MSEGTLFQRPKPVVLAILDGFGVAPKGDGNAITEAYTPVLNACLKRYPAMTLRASGDEVGLSWGEMGNSEVGHLTLGAGRVYYQLFPRIQRSIEQGDFFKNAAFLEAITHVKKTGGMLHIVGLVSPGNIHSSQEHAFALLELAKRERVGRVGVHVILDGRDTVYNAGIDFVKGLQEKMDHLGVGVIGSLSGRKYAMDRDGRYERIQAAYQAIVRGEGRAVSDVFEAIKTSYQHEVCDEEFLPATVVRDGKAVASIHEGDAVIFFNFRPDRMRQLVDAVTNPLFDRFDRETFHEVVCVTMAEYDPSFAVKVAFPKETIVQGLSEVLSQHELKQLHVAETEKYAHVTHFFNGTREEPFPLEERILVPSPHVTSYDQTPAMSAREVTEKVLEAIKSDKFDVMIVNYANADMVGHTGQIDATKRAIEVLDECIGKIMEQVLAKDGVLLVTADHGNAEEMKNLRTGEIDKEHSTNPVPFLIIGNRFEGKTASSGEVPQGDLSLVPPVGVLADVAPTVLAVLGIEPPAQMTGVSLL